MKYSLDFRNLAVKLYQTFGSVRKTASYVSVPKSTLHNWLRSNRLVRDRRDFRKVTHDVAALIERVIHRNPFSTVAQITTVIKNELHTTLSQSCIRYWISSLGYSRKKPSFVTQRADIDVRRREFADTHSSRDPRSYISIDETSLFFDMKPSKGYAKRGSRLVHSKHTHHRFRLSLILAIGTEGILAHQLVRGSVDSTCFAQFIASIDQPGRALLLDNAAFHKSRVVRDAIQSNNLDVAYLPPYTPQFQPVEHFFATLKSQYRKTSPSTPAFSAEDVAARLGACLEQIRGHNMANLFRACWARLETFKTT